MPQRHNFRFVKNIAPKLCSNAGFLTKCQRLPVISNCVVIYHESIVGTDAVRYEELRKIIVWQIFQQAIVSIWLWFVTGNVKRPFTG